MCADTHAKVRCDNARCSATCDKKKKKNDTKEWWREIETYTHTVHKRMRRRDSDDKKHAEAMRGGPVVSHRATYLFGSFRSGGVSVSTSVESVKIKPNCEGRRRMGGGGEEGGGHSVKSSTR